MDTTQHSTLVQTALAAFEGYKDWDFEKILSVRTEDCTIRVFPESLQQQSYNNEQYCQYLATLKPLIHGLTFHFSDIIEDHRKHQVALHGKSQTTSIIGPYANEYVVLMTMTEDHKKISQIKEFVDSSYAQDFFSRLWKAAAKTES